MAARAATDLTGITVSGTLRFKGKSWLRLAICVMEPAGVHLQLIQTNHDPATTTKINVLSVVEL